MILDLEILDAIYTNKGNDLYSITQKQSVMLVFLRHLGCIFCKEALDDFASIKNALEQRSVKLVFVHMAEEEVGDEYLTQFGLQTEEHISDPDMSLYEYFGLQKGGFRELYGLKVWTRVGKLKYGVEAKKHLGNMRQMPGVFVIDQGRVINSFVHKSASDRPDYLALLDEVYNKTA